MEIIVIPSSSVLLNHCVMLNKSLPPICFHFSMYETRGLGSS